jgi:hypothetical protein
MVTRAIQITSAEPPVPRLTKKLVNIEPPETTRVLGADRGKIWTGS